MKNTEHLSGDPLRALHARAFPGVAAQQAKAIIAKEGLDYVVRDDGTVEAPDMAGEMCLVYANPHDFLLAREKKAEERAEQNEILRRIGGTPMDVLARNLFRMQDSVRGPPTKEHAKLRAKWDAFDDAFRLAQRKVRQEKAQGARS